MLTYLPEDLSSLYGVKEEVTEELQGLAPREIMNMSSEASYQL